MRSSFLWLLLITCSEVFGQQLYISSGLNLSHQKSDKNNIDFFQEGFVGGVSIQGNEDTFINLGMDILFSQKGIEYREKGYTMSETINYVELPFYLSGRISDQLSIVVGPYLGFWMGTRKKTKLEKDTFLIELLGINETNSNLDLGGCVGISYHPNRLLIQLRGSAGLANIKSEKLPGEKVKNQVISLMIGYKIYS